MRKRLFTFVLCLGAQSAAWGLDAESQKLADRYLAILVANPMQQTAFDRLWKIHAEAGEIEALVAACREKGTQAPVLYARVLQRAGHIAEAKRVLGEAAQSGNISAVDMLAAILEEEGDIRAAAELVEKASATDRSAALLVRLGELLQKAGEPDKSRAAWIRAVALDPEDLALRKRLAAACAQTGDWQEAVVHLQVIAMHGSPAERFSAWGEISLRLEGGRKDRRGDRCTGRPAGLDGSRPLAAGFRAPETAESARQESLARSSSKEKWRAQAEANPQDPQPALRMARFTSSRATTGSGATG